MKFFLIFGAVIVIAGSIFADYKWRQWIASHNPRQSEFHDPPLAPTPASEERFPDTPVAADPASRGGQAGIDSTSDPPSLGP